MNSLIRENQQVNNVNPIQNPNYQPEVPEAEEYTLGQKLADKMAAGAGSWGFIIGQTTILAGWVGLNMMPGVPHWDQPPFILLNLVFSFASAYTAPIVMMSQNRQSEIDRQNAFSNYQLNIKNGQQVEQIYQRMQAIHAVEIEKLSEIIAQQEEAINELKASVLPRLPLETEVSNVLPFNFAKSFTQETKAASNAGK